MAASEKELTPGYGCPSCPSGPFADYDWFRNPKRHAKDCAALDANFVGGRDNFCFWYDGKERTDQLVTDRSLRPDAKYDTGNAEARPVPLAPPLVGFPRMHAARP